MMPNDMQTKYGTGEFPPPREFGDTGTRYIHLSQRPDALRTNEQRGDPHLAPVKTVGLLCASAIAIFVLALALWVAECAGLLFDEANAAEQMTATMSAEGVAQIGLASTGDSKTGINKSTPRSEWRQGVTPMLYQKDPEWAYAFYGGGVILTHGCGPTSLSMAYIRLTGNTDMDPKAMAKFAENNEYIDCGITSWQLMGEGAELLGLNSREISPNPESIRDELLKDNQVICSVHAGDFTTDGHFILLTDMNPDGTVEIRDPNSEERTLQAWDLDRIISQCNNIWSLSV